MVHKVQACMYVTTCTHHDVTESTYRRRAAVTLLAVLFKTVAAHGAVVDGCGQVVQTVVEALGERVSELLQRARRPVTWLITAATRHSNKLVNSSSEHDDQSRG